MAKLHLFSPFDGISESDKKTRDYIEKYHAKSYDSVLANETDFEVFMNLTDLSTGILNWYQFPVDEKEQPSAEMLVIGAKFGTVAGMLCDKCRHVVATERVGVRAKAIAERFDYCDNMDVWCGDISDETFRDMIFESSRNEDEYGYDYILVQGVLELQGNTENRSDKVPYITYLKNLTKLLKNNGKIIIAAENRFGLRYLCGAPETFSGMAFNGISGYVQGARGYAFSRAELQDIVAKAGLLQSRFYYPLPDYKLPQLIYSDEYLPERNIKERLIPYYTRTDTLVAEELELYYDVVENKVFPFVANSFIVECSRIVQDEESVVYAALSTDRGRDASFATCILKSGSALRVVKQPLFEEGRLASNRVYDNICKLEAEGISVIKHTIDEVGRLCMPYINFPTVSNYIKDIVKRGKDILSIYNILDRIYSDIITSSKHVEEVAPIFQREQIDCKDWGPILETAYLELIPMNSFINPESKKILYFDQEYTMSHYPAGYVMYRAIRYLYFFTPGLESVIAKEELLERYGMKYTWIYYEQEELRFLARVRLQEQYKTFYRQAFVDRSNICDNILLASKMK